LAPGSPRTSSLRRSRGTCRQAPGRRGCSRRRTLPRARSVGRVAGGTSVRTEAIRYGPRPDDRPEVAALRSLDGGNQNERWPSSKALWFETEETRFCGPFAAGCGGLGPRLASGVFGTFAGSRPLAHRPCLVGAVGAAAPTAPQPSGRSRSCAGPRSRADVQQSRLPLVEFEWPGCATTSPPARRSSLRIGASTSSRESQRVGDCSESSDDSRRGHAPGPCRGRRRAAEATDLGRTTAQERSKRPKPGPLHTKLTRWRRSVFPAENTEPAVSSGFFRLRG
jgi:hypothetical protein